MSRFRRIKPLGILLVAVMILGVFPTMASAAPHSDIEGHWAKEQIEVWLQKGLAGGYPDGTFRPDHPVSRAEFATFANRAFGIKAEGGEEVFSDVSAEVWYSAEINAAKNAGYISGYPDGTFRPNNPITRQEAAVIVAKLLDLQGGAGEEFADHQAIAPWAKEAVEAVRAAGIMGGYPDGTFRPTNSITRAETVVTLQKALEVKEPGKEFEKVFDQAGVYGPEEGREVIEGDAAVTAPGVTLQNITITGDLLLDEGIGDGDVTLKGVTVKGETIVKGGGSNSINIQDSNLAHLTVTKEGVRIVASGSTRVTVTTLESGAILVSVTDNESGGFQNVIISEEIAPQAKITLEGDFAEVNVKGAVSELEIADGNVKEINIEAPVKVTGEGTVTTANIEVNGVEIEQKPKKTNISEGVTATVAGEEVKGDKTPSLGGGGGGGKTTISVSAISITTEPDKTVYKLGEELDLTGLVVTATYTDGTTKIVEHSKLTVSGFDNETVGEQQITVTYEGKTATFVVTVVEDPEEPTEANFISTGKVGIAPDTAGDAAGKIYAEYKLVANKEDISLAASNVKYIKVKVGEDGEWKDLTANTDATLWFNVEADQGVRYYEVKTKDGKVYTATLNWDKEINTTATWEATGKEGIRPGTEDTYVEYKLMDGENQVSLKIGDVKLIASKEGEKWVELEPNTDETLWFNKAHETGSYDFFIVTSDGTMYKVTLDWVETIAAAVDYKAVWNESRGTWYIKVTVPEEKLDKDSVQSIHVIKEAGEELDEPRALTPDTDKVMWFGVAKGDGEVTLKADGEYAYKVVRTDGSEYIFSFTYTSSEVKGVEKPDEPVEKAGTWKATGNTGFNTVDGKAYVFQEFELLVDGERISLHKDNIKSITSNGKALTPNTDHTLWFNVLAEAGEREFVVVDKNDVTYKATLNWTAPAEVTATAEGAPIYNESLGATYQKYNVEGVSLVGFDAMYQIKPSGEISKLVESGDDCLWFKVDADEEGWAQEEGDHIFLVKHGETWSQFTVNYKAEEEPEVVEGTWNATGRTGFNTVDGKAYVFQEFELLVEGERISLHKDNIKSITSSRR